VGGSHQWPFPNLKRYIYGRVGPSLSVFALERLVVGAEVAPLQSEDIGCHCKWQADLARKWLEYWDAIDVLLMRQ